MGLVKFHNLAQPGCIRVPCLLLVLSPVRSVTDYKNGGPQCNVHGTTTIDRQCSFVCKEIWKRRADTHFLTCYDPLACFTEFWESKQLRDEPEVHSSVVETLQQNCSFNRYQQFSLEQLESNVAFGGEALCKEKEFEVVDFVSGHPSAFLGGEGNCLVYSQAEEAATACQKDKELNDRLYCVLGIGDIPAKPALSDLCDFAPSEDYKFALFYNCVPCEPQSFNRDTQLRSNITCVRP
ncbi:uncharacterized protein EMH_0008770 [Eimeria mitis]|uniref:Uncharacterized protein n=1 Tax=Eimeria mitis TaxID=44415 RepID=U6KDN2_9EIME|nr:uncharacterized protein EMH_0008770 [Eimeria mitis]CDJ36145.1 hypothetical protein, conserved [Eimeria mitis]